MPLKKIVASLVLLAIPVVVVWTTRHSEYGAAWSTPSYRQSGPASAKVTIIEYSDFQCPACSRIQPQLKEWMNTYEGKVRLLFKHYPLTKIHRNALPAAVAAECAGRQKQFWAYSKSLYERQSQWGPLADATTHYLALATELQLDMAAFGLCRADPQTQATVLLDVDEAKARGVNATPTFFINGQRMVGNVFAADGARIIERGLRE